MILEPFLAIFSVSYIKDVFLIFLENLFSLKVDPHGDYRFEAKHRKLNDEIFQKSRKKPILGTFLKKKDPVTFFSKIWLSLIYDLRVLTSCKKSETLIFGKYYNFVNRHGLL